jgi:hypothetical protein
MSGPDQPVNTTATELPDAGYSWTAYRMGDIQSARIRGSATWSDVFTGENGVSVEMQVIF